MKKIFIMLAALLTFSSCSKSISETPRQTEAAEMKIASEKVFSTDAEVPHYKLKENIKQMFRREWVWNEEKQDYDDLDGLVRDPETGLFPQPEPFPEALEGDAYWDGYLGLYIINSIEINHETGEIIENPLAGTVSVRNDWPEYIKSKNDPFDCKYFEFKEIENEKYARGDGQVMHNELYIIEHEGLTEEWFGLSATDLPMLLDKLEGGSPPSYTMSMILLVTKADIGLTPFYGAPHRYFEWVDAFNDITLNAERLVGEKKYEDLGYLALPIVYKQLNSGNEEMLYALPEIAYGLYTDEKSDAEDWDGGQWLDWFESHRDIVDALQYTLDYEINMPWLLPSTANNSSNPAYVVIECITVYPHVRTENVILL